MAFRDPVIPERFVSLNNRKLVTHKLKHLSNCQASSSSFFLYLMHSLHLNILLAWKFFFWEIIWASLVSTPSKEMDQPKLIQETKYN